MSMNPILKYLFCVFLVGISFLSNAQNTYKRDSTFLDHANTYINKKLGKEFVKKNLKLLNLYISYLTEVGGHTVVVYETTITKNPEGRNSLIVYFRAKTYEVDTVLSVLKKDEIMKSIRGDSNCTLYIGVEKATKIASGLKECVQPPFTIGVDAFSEQVPKWTFYAQHNFSIKTLRVNMTDGDWDLELSRAEQ